MRPMNIPHYIVFAMLIVLNINCTNKPQPLLPPAKPNTAPSGNAGQDKLVFFPTNLCTLNGTALDSENNIRTILWSKISGPSSFLIEHSDSLLSKVSNLQIGVYQFELTVTDSRGMSGKDTIKVTVNQITGNEIILENQTWIFPWYSAIKVKDFYNLIPSGSVFRIYIRRDTNTDWIEAPSDSNNWANGSYEYFIETRPDGAGIYTYGSLYILHYGVDDPTDTPDIKVVF